MKSIIIIIQLLPLLQAVKSSMTIDTPSQECSTRVIEPPFSRGEPFLRRPAWATRGLIARRHSCLTHHVASFTGRVGAKLGRHLTVWSEHLFFEIISIAVSKNGKPNNDQYIGVSVPLTPLRPSPSFESGSLTLDPRPLFGKGHHSLKDSTWETSPSKFRSDTFGAPHKISPYTIIA